MNSNEPRLKGVVKDVGLERDEEHFRSFNLKIGVVVKAEKSLSYEEGERMMRQFRKEFLGKEVEIASIIFRCLKCGREFNNEQGLKRHTRIAHEAKKAEKRSLKTTGKNGKRKVEKKILKKKPPKKDNKASSKK